MKILHFVVVPSDERFTVLADAISASHGSLGVAAVFTTGQRVLLRDNICIEEFYRVAKEHDELVRMRYAGKRGPWYEMLEG
jgi:hypothetical protein